MKATLKTGSFCVQQAAGLALRLSVPVLRSRGRLRSGHWNLKRHYWTSIFSAFTIASTGERQPERNSAIFFKLNRRPPPPLLKHQRSAIIPELNAEFRKNMREPPSNASRCSASMLADVALRGDEFPTWKKDPLCETLKAIKGIPKDTVTSQL